MLNKIIFIGVFPFLLSGCIGSTFMVEDTDNSATFPDLHEVPQRPIIQERPKETLMDDQITQTQQDDLHENQRLRQEHGL